MISNVFWPEASISNSIWSGQASFSAFCRGIFLFGELKSSVLKPENGLR
jgi:hypothetical protein